MVFQIVVENKKDLPKIGNLFPVCKKLEKFKGMKTVAEFTDHKILNVEKAYSFSLKAYFVDLTLSENAFSF